MRTDSVKTPPQLSAEQELGDIAFQMAMTFVEPYLADTGRSPQTSRERQMLVDAITATVGGMALQPELAKRATELIGAIRREVARSQ